MSRNNTGNPIDSKAYADFEDNVANFDQWSISDADSFKDRKGEERLTLRGTERAGAGDTSVAVDAAARAVAAAGKVEQDAEQIAQEAAQQAVDNVVIVVDEAVAVAQSAADRAEAAAASALLAGNLFDTTTQGIAATADGQYFLINTEDPQVFDVYLNDSGVAVLQPEQFKVASGSQVENNKKELIETIEAKILTYPNPQELTRVGTPSATFLEMTPNASFSNGVVGLGVSVGAANSPLGAESLVSASPEPGAVLVVTHDFEMTEKTDPIGNPGFGLMVGETSLILADNGILIYSNPTGDGSETTEPTGLALGPYGVGDLVSLELTFGGPVVLCRRAINGIYSSQFPLPLLPTSGPVSFVYRRSLVGVSRVISRYCRVDELTPAQSLSSILFLDSTLELATQVHRERWTDPAAIPSVHATGGDLPKVTSLGQIGKEKPLLDIDWGSALGSGAIGATHLASSALKAGLVIRLTAQLLKSNTTPAFGLAFGNDTDSAKGFILRTTGQLLIGDVSDNTASGLTGPAPRTYAVGDTVTMDARLLGGTPGNYSVRYYLEYNDGVRFGPYDVSGIDSVDDAWFMVRSASAWTDIQLSYHEAPLYAAELIGESSAGGVGAPTIYVSPAGDDNNAGTKIAPVATINKARSLLPGEGVIELAEGEYRGLVGLGGLTGRVEIRCEPYKRAAILGSVQLMLIKTPGYDQVYQADLATKPTGMGGGRGAPMIFEWGTPSKPILEAERHDLHRGQTHRLPYTEMLEATSISALDEPAGQGMWFWEAGVIYLASVGGGDATLKRYEVRANTCMIANGAELAIRRLDLFFSSTSGLRSRGLGKLYREDCRLFGSYQDGWQDDANITVAVRDEAGGCGNDGINGHARPGSASTGNREETYMAEYFDPWCHDNYDDGHSYHERGECSIHGGLMEYNGKAGVVQVTGAMVVCYGTISRHAINGFYVATTPLDDRSGSVLRCHGTISENNDYNYRAASPGSLLLAFDCVSGEARIMGYSADPEGSGGGKIVARNCRHGGDPANAKAGDVTVINDAMLAA